MSFTCTIIEGSGKYIYSIADKRMGIAKVLPGEEMGDYVFLNDDALKILKISNNIYMSGFGIVDTGERFLKELLPKSHLKPSEIIEHAKAICRKTPLGYDHKDYDGVRIFGIYDDGSLFVWQGNVDGSETLRFAIPGKAIILLGGGSKVAGLKHGTEYLTKALKEKKTKLQSLVDTIDFMASIDVQVSKTFDCVIISKDNKTSVEYCDCIKETDEVIAEYNQDNYIKILNAQDESLLTIDDDVALESINIIGGVANYNRGPGIVVGNTDFSLPGDVSTLGRKGVFTRGFLRAAYGNASSEMTKDGVTTTGLINATGKATVGSLKSNGAVQVMDGGTERTGLTYQTDVRVGGDEFYRMRWVNGILVSSTLVP